MYSAISSRFSADNLAVRDLNDSYHQDESFEQEEERFSRDPQAPRAEDLQFYHNNYCRQEMSYIMEEEEEDDDDTASVSVQPGIGGNKLGFLEKFRDTTERRTDESGDRSMPTVESSSLSSGVTSCSSPGRSSLGRQQFAQRSYLHSYLAQQHHYHEKISRMEEPDQESTCRGYIHTDQGSSQLSSLSSTLTPSTFGQESSFSTSQEPLSDHDRIHSYSELSSECTSCCGPVRPNRTVALADGISTACGSEAAASTVCDSDGLLEECFAALEQEMEESSNDDAKENLSPLENGLPVQNEVPQNATKDATDCLEGVSAPSNETRKEPQDTYQNSSDLEPPQNRSQLLPEEQDVPDALHDTDSNGHPQEPSIDHANPELVPENAPEKQFYPLACASTETTMTSFSTVHLDSSREEEEEEDNDGPLESSSWEEANRDVQQELASYADITDEDQLRQEIEKDFPHQSDRQRTMAMAFLQGLCWRKERFASEIRDLEQQHQQELQRQQQEEEVHQKQQTPQDHHAKGGQQLEKQARSAAFRSRWLAKQRANKEEEEVDQPGADTRTLATTAVSCVSTMSCRELSMRKYQLSFLNKQRSNKKEEATEQADKKNSAEIQCLLEELQQSERRQKKLEQQLKQAGVVLAEDIPYQQAKDQVARISKRMNEIGSSEATHHNPNIQKSLREEYFRLEKDMEKYMNALMLTDEFMEEQKALEAEWEKKQEEDNRQALEKLRRFMPVDIRKRTKIELQQMGVPEVMIRKFQRTNVLQLLRRDPQVIARWHPCNLEALRLTGLTLTERRALYHHLLPVSKALANKGSDPFTERKLNWIAMMRVNLKRALDEFQRHLEATDGKRGRDHKCCLIGKQCPVRADQTIDYSGDGLGFPFGDVYEESFPESEESLVSVLPKVEEARQPTKDERIPHGAVGSPSKKMANRAAPAAPQPSFLEAISARRQN